MEAAHGAVYLMDIPVRFEFEKAFHEERLEEEVEVSRLCGLMAQTQRRLFGDALEEGGEDPLFWASKLHFYITSLTFYNFPYTFGFLLSRGLFARFRQEGAAFLPRYEEFLRRAGSDTAENVARESNRRRPGVAPVLAGGDRHPPGADRAAGELWPRQAPRPGGRS